MKKILIALAFSLPVLAHSGVWDATTPAGSDPISQGDDRIREFKVAVAEGLDWSGVFPGTNPATAPMFQWTENFGTAANRTSLYLQSGQTYISTDTGVREMYNGTAWKNVSISSYTTSSLNLNTGSFSLSGNITSDGNITSSGDDVDITTHTSITGNLSVSGSLTVGSFNPSATHVIATLSSPGPNIADGATVAISSWTDSVDSLGEMGSSAFVAINAGVYDLCLRQYLYPAAGSLDGFAAYVEINGGGVVGAPARVLDEFEVTSRSTHMLTGCSTFNLSASDSLKIWVTCGTTGGAVCTADGSNGLYRSELSIQRRL